jgi:tRNA(fMet)-specific endonuclease VapC
VKYLLDTDYLSIIQRKTGQDYVKLSTRMTHHPLSDFTVSVITFHEQIIGSHTYINRAHNANDVIKGYEIMERILRDFKVLSIILFDKNAANIFNNLQSRQIKLATMDLRIASIAMSRGLILLTRNNKDFSKVPGLLIEDWTI